MDPVTAAILGAAATGAGAAGTEAAKHAGADGYRALKDLLARKLGRQSEAVEAIDQLENQPDSGSLQEAVKNRLAHAPIQQDSDVVNAAQALLEQIKQEPAAQPYYQAVRATNVGQTVYGDVHINYQHAGAAQTAVPDPAAAQAKLAEMPTEALPEPLPLPPGSRMPRSPNRRFIGRERDLKNLAAALKGGGPAAVGQSPTITGWGGVGKTQLATEFAYRYGQYFPGGVFWIGFADPDAVPAEVAACGGPDALNLYKESDSLPLNDRVGLVWRAWQSDVPRLLIFDNCEDPELVETWRPKQGACRVLVTSRRSTWPPGLGVTALSLDELPRGESIQLLRGHRPDLSPDNAGLNAIAAELGDLPLALHLAGSFLARYRPTAQGDPATYLEGLRRHDVVNHPSLARGARSPTPHEQHVARTFALSAERLDPDDPVDLLARAALDRAAWFAAGEPIPAWLLRRSLEIQEGDEEAELRVADALHRLRELGLIDRDDQAGEVILHRLVAAFARNTAEDADTARQAVETAAAAAAKEENDREYPGPLLAWQAHLRTVAETAAAYDSAVASHLLNNLGYHLHMIADYAGAKAAFERALEIDEGTYGPDHPDVAIWRNNLGAVLQDQRDLVGAKAQYEAALAIDERAYGPDHPTVAIDRNNLGRVLRHQGDPDGAKAQYERALEIDEKALGPDHPQVAAYRNNLGRVLKDRGDLEGAKAQYEAALAIDERAYGPDHPTVAYRRNNLGSVLKDQGDPDGAKAQYERALAIFAASLGPHHPNTVTVRNNLRRLQDD